MRRIFRIASAAVPIMILPNTAWAGLDCDPYQGPVMSGLLGTIVGFPFLFALKALLLNKRLGSSALDSFKLDVASIAGLIGSVFFQLCLYTDIPDCVNPGEASLGTWWLLRLAGPPTEGVLILGTFLLWALFTGLEIFVARIAWRKAIRPGYYGAAAFMNGLAHIFVGILAWLSPF